MQNKIKLLMWLFFKNIRIIHLENFKQNGYCEIGANTVIDAKHGVVLEGNNRIGQNCTLLSYSSIQDKSGRIILEENSSVGANSVILPGVRIGVNSIVGAGAVVTKSIPDNELWAGVPAEFKKVIE